MEATLNTQAANSRGRKSSREPNLTTAAFRTLLSKIDKLEADGTIERDYAVELRAALRKVYMERLAEKFVEIRLFNFVDKINANLCQSLSAYMDPHVNREHFNFNYKSKELRILSYDK